MKSLRSMCPKYRGKIKHQKALPATPLAPTTPAISRSEQIWKKWLSDRKEKIESLSKTSLDSWIKGAGDGSQIEGAKVDTVERAGPWIYVRMYKDNRKTPESHMHDAFFHILFDTSLDVVYKQRGPDEIE